MSEEDHCDDPTRYHHIIVSGLPYQRGLSYGQQVKEKIQRSIQYYKASETFLPWSECVQFVQSNYVGAIKKFCPNGWEEMRGIAEGAAVSFDDILVVNARYDLSRIQRAKVIAAKSRIENPDMEQLRPTHKNSEHPAVTTPGECTGAVALSSATDKGEVLLGQNWDMHEFILKNATSVLLEVHPDPSENIVPFIMLTEAGQLGRSGMNANGMGVVGMSLWSTADKFFRSASDDPIGWVPNKLLRRIFIESSTFSAGLQAIMRTPRHVSSNLIIATDEDEALNLELTPNGYFFINVPLEKEVLSHSNNFKAASFIGRHDIQESSGGSTSLFRDRRVQKILNSHWPHINEGSFELAFKDHAGFPNSVCKHSVPEEMKYISAEPKVVTVASIILNLSRRTLELCKGPPCSGIYHTYNMNVTVDKQSLIQPVMNYTKGLIGIIAYRTANKEYLGSNLKIVRFFTNFHLNLAV